MHAASALGKHGGIRRLHGNDADFGILPLQISARTRDRAAGSDAATKISTATVGVFPDLRTRRGGMNGGIGGVRELPE